MSRSNDLCSRTAAVLAIALLWVPLTPRSASAFTQKALGLGVGTGDLVPMGHEWLTRLAAIELLKYEPGEIPDCKPDVKWCDDKDPRKTWTQGLAKNLDLSSPGAQAEVRRIKAWTTNEGTYRARYKPVLDAILGQRWVDIAGYNVLTSNECWVSVAQEAVEVQFDHFMRRWNDFNAEGGVVAAQESRKLFEAYFLAAAMAPQTIMFAYDGGATASKAMEVDRNYFLFGRAVHLFQDSFSSEHTVRIESDNFVEVRQVLSYLCAAGAEQHSHSKGAVIDYSSGDVIWTTRFDYGWQSFKASNMKQVPLVATEASKDLWAAFIRTMGTPMQQREEVARAEAKALANNWLSFKEDDMRKWYDDPGHRGRTYVRSTTEDPDGADVKKCMRELKLGTEDPAVRAAQLVASQRKCLYNALPWDGYSDLADPSMKIWFSWRWLNGPINPMDDPPPGWQVPQLPADSGTRIRIKSALNGQYMGVESIAAEQNIACNGRNTPLDLILIGPKDKAVFRVASNPNLFLSYWTAGGKMKLYDFNRPVVTSPTSYKIEPAAVGWSIKNWWGSRYYYTWLYSDSHPYISRSGDPGNQHSRWYIEGLR